MEVKVVKIRSKQRAIDGFRTMYQVKVSAVPIVDDKGKLVGCLSSSDVRNLDEDNVEDVLLPVLQFLVHLASMNLAFLFSY